uniref:Prostaglandin D2 receptor 2-like n=1 Tax=Kryptolebias marmoratus TaxID=37003 RepID=A0A3Q2ZCR5_KRYMA
MTLNMTDPYCPLINRMRNHTSNTTGRNWMVVSIHGLVSCLGILENALIIWVLGFRLRKHTVICIWVLNLSLSDFLACLTLPLFTAYLYHSQSWVLGNALCTAQSSVFYFNMFVSAFLLSVISLDRLLLVVKPVWSKNHRSVAGAWKVCALGWLWAVINTLPYSVFRSVIEKNDGKKLCYHNFALYLSTNKSLETECYMRQAATAISKILFAFLTKINNFFIKTFTSDSSSKSFTKMVAFVIVSFTLLWAPYHILCMMEVTAEKETMKEIYTIVETWLPLAATFSFLNPVLNPVLYAFSCPQFCMKIRQNLAAVFEGLVEERGGLEIFGQSSVPSAFSLLDNSFPHTWSSIILAVKPLSGPLDKLQTLDFKS